MGFLFQNTITFFLLSHDCKIVNDPGLSKPMMQSRGDFFSIHFFENVLYKFCHTIGTYVGTSRHVMYLLGTSRPPVLLFYLGLTFFIFIKTEIS